MPEKKKFLLRLDGDLYEALEKWAADDLQRQRRDGISAEGGGPEGRPPQGFIKRRPARPGGTINAKRRADRERSPGRKP